MKIPGEEHLDDFAAQLVDNCFSTRRDRVPAYQGLRHYYLFGAQEGQQAPYGKIYPHIDLLTSYLYSQATVEFDVAVQNVPDVITEQSELIAQRLNTNFHDYGAADAFKHGISWSLVYNSMFMKCLWVNGGLKPYMVEPHNLGVLREDVPDLDDQEAFAHAYTISKDELKRRVSMMPNAADIMRRVSASPQMPESAFPESVNRIIVAGTSQMTSQTTQGIINIPELFNQLQYKPKTVEDVVEMYELWVWDDDKEDYRTITVAAPGVVIYGRKDVGNLIGIKGEHPFIHICPNPLYDYFFGWPEIMGLIKLQDWTSQRLREIRHLLSMQARPPKVFSGFGGISDEKFAAMDSPGSWLSEATPNAKAETLAPELPTNIWEEIGMIQSMFNDVSGLSDVLQGKGESGVRAKAHADTLAKLGSARIKQRAQTVERTLEDIGKLIVRYMKKKDDFKYTLKDGKQFTAAQFTDDFQIHVDAHSASPVFVDDHMQLAFALKKLGAIGNEDLLKMTKPPRLDALIKANKETEAKRAQMQQQQLAMQAQGGEKPKGLKAV